MSQPVRAVRAAIVAGVLAASFVLVLYVLKPVPDWAIGLFGGPTRPIDRYGGLSLTFRPASGSAAAFDQYVADRGSVARRQQGVVVVDFPGLPEGAANETIELLSYGGLTMQEVVEGSDYAKQIGEREDVKIEVDQWHPEDGGGLHTDLYLMAWSSDAMAAAVAGYQPPEGTQLAFEWVEPGGYRPEAKPFVRSYLVKTEVAVDGTMIASAVGSYDPSSGRPIVLLDFNREGTQRFCELTERIAGRKLATIVGGRVKSAPIVNGRICGGRVSIAMGAADPVRQESERDALVAVLQTGAIPEGTIESQQWKPAADVDSEAWKARGLFGLIAGLVLAVIVFVCVRLTRPTVRPRIAKPDGGVPWRRIAVTALAPIVLLASSFFTLPGVNEVELEHISARGGGGSALDVTVTALGVTPIITAFLLVELVALAFPRLRWRRHDPRGRIGLGRAVAAVAIALSLLQGYFLAGYLESLSRYGAEIVTPGLRLQLLVMLSLATGTMLLAIIAGLIREHGLGNGYAVLMTTSFLFEVAQPYLIDGPENAHHYVSKGTLLGLVGALCIAVATRAMLRWRVEQLRLPTSGITPVNDMGGILMAVVLLTSLGLGDAFAEVTYRLTAIRASDIWSLVILVVSVPLWAWLFARPQIAAGITWPAWIRATGLTLLFLGIIGLAGIYMQGVDAWAIAIMTPVSVMVATATLLDIRDDLRARRRALVPVGILHQAQYVPLVERVLDEAGIAAHFHASHVRTLFAFFGPWAPIIVLVPEADADVARSKVYETVTKEHHAVVQAFARDARPTPARPLVPALARTT
ncbi:MAG: hypothetical protein M4D80_10485 [Myxococcota bacterium]|nr:hypothetical protein [Myxococcota bacterium]